MNKLLFLGLSAAYAALSTHAAVAAGNAAINGSAPSIAAAGQTISLPQPANFDASLAAEVSKLAFGSANKPQLAMPEVINSGLRYTRTKPAGILSTHYDQQS